jgi:hypothetical protein
VISHPYLARKTKEPRYQGPTKQNRKEKMKPKSKNTARTTTQLLTLAILSTTMACATTHTRDERLVENMEMQNAVIEAAKADRTAPDVQTEIEKSDVLKEAEAKLGKALDALKDANKTVIAKIKPTDKKECADGKDQGDDDEQ